MNNLVNIISQIQREIQGSGITLRLENYQVYLDGPAVSSCLRIVQIHRPSSQQITREASSDVLLVLTAATPKAIQSALHHNYILIPGDNYRIVVPGIALLHNAPLMPLEASRQVRLTGRTGVIAESLLLGGRKEWSVRELAANANAAPTLAHRVLTRLEHEAFLTRNGKGPKTTRVLTNPRGLAELWSQEEKPPRPILRGFLYAASMEALARKVLEVCHGGAVGGTLAANLYKPVLTRVPPPLRIWISDDFVPETLKALGFQQTDSGANIEFVQAKDDLWRVHMCPDGIPKVSQWRAWLEIANAEGRTQELAETLLSDLE